MAMYSPTPKLFLLDGMSLVYRAHFALSKAKFMTANQVETGPILGFLNTLLHVIEHNQPTHIMVAFDAKGPTFRHQLYAPYKSHRQKQPDAITAAMPYIRSLLDGFRIQHVTCIGYEADDLMGTLAQQASRCGVATYILSADKDLAQMVNHNTYLYRPANGKKKAVILDQAAVLKEWQIQRTSQVTDILALAGDASDGIPGIPSVGHKTAQMLIERFDSLENLLAHADHLTGKIKNNLMQYAEQGMLSKKLATICTQAPIALNLAACKYYGPDQSELMPLLQSLELSSVIKRLLPGLGF